MAEPKKTAARKPALKFKDPLIQWRPYGSSGLLNGYVGEQVLFHVNPNKPERVAMGDAPYVLTASLPISQIGPYGFKTDAVEAAKEFAAEIYKDWYKALRKATEA